MIPLLATLVSGGTLLLQLAIGAWRRPRHSQADDGTAKAAVLSPVNASEDGLTNKLKTYTVAHGGVVITAFKIARLLGNLALFALSLVSIFGDSERQQIDWDSALDGRHLPNVGLAITYVSPQSRGIKTLPIHCSGIHLFSQPFP